MQIITAIDRMIEFARRAKKNNRTVGLVPTMGYLHAGHMSLMHRAKKECDAVVVSIFVNPAQFAPGEDFEKYPRDTERDKRLMEKEGVEVVFMPSIGEMYPEGNSTCVSPEGDFAKSLCGASRPGHFKGVTTVVAKLFNIVAPDKAYFGQKDAQQAVVVKRMVRDLNMPIEIRVMPTAREKDGLAMSSRNTHLSGDLRRQALGLFRSLELAKKMVSRGEISSGHVKEEMRKILSEEKDVKVDYVEIRDADDLSPIAKVKSNTLIAVAAVVGTTRLIDNIIIS